MGNKSIREWNIYPDQKRGQYFKVFLFPDKDAMYVFEHVVRTNAKQTKQSTRDSKRLGYKFEALTTSFVEQESDKRIGYLLFHNGFFGGGVVSHEITHAAFAVWEMRKLSFGALRKKKHSKQEDFAMMIERMTMDFWVGYYNKKKHAIKPNGRHSAAV